MTSHDQLLDLVLDEHAPLHPNSNNNHVINGLNHRHEAPLPTESPFGAIARPPRPPPAVSPLDGAEEEEVPPPNGPRQQQQENAAAATRNQAGMAGAPPPNSHHQQRDVLLDIVRRTDNRTMGNFSHPSPEIQLMIDNLNLESARTTMNVLHQGIPSSAEADWGENFTPAQIRRYHHILGTSSSMISELLQYLQVSLHNDSSEIRDTIADLGQQIRLTLARIEIPALGDPPRPLGSQAGPTPPHLRPRQQQSAATEASAREASDERATRHSNGGRSLRPSIISMAPHLLPSFRRHLAHLAFDLEVCALDLPNAQGLLNHLGLSQAVIDTLYASQAAFGSAGVVFRSRDGL